MSTSSFNSTVPLARSSTAARSRDLPGAVLLVGGAACLALGRLLSTNGGSPAQRLHDMAGAQVQVTVSVLLALAGFAGLLAGLLAVVARVEGRLARTGAVLSVAGCLGFSVLVAVDAVTAAAARVGSTAPMEEFLRQLDSSPAILGVTPFAVVGYFVGPFLVALAARRAGLVPRWLPWGVLASLVLQPVGVALQGPAFAHVADTVFQLALVAMTTELARRVLLRRP